MANIWHVGDKTAGFTLTELLLSIAIITLLVSLSLPVYATFQTRNDLDLTAQTIAQMLRRTQIYSRGVNGDSQWGLAIQAGSAVVFKGASYAARDSAYDETVSIPGSLSTGGLTEITFTKLDGAPSTTGTITLTANTGDIKSVTINAKGMVDY